MNCICLWKSSMLITIFCLYLCFVLDNLVKKKFLYFQICWFNREVNKAFCGFIDQSKYQQYEKLFREYGYCETHNYLHVKDPNYMEGNDFLVQFSIAFLIKVVFCLLVMFNMSNGISMTSFNYKNEFDIYVHLRCLVWSTLVWLLVVQAKY